ncbi:P-loop containing nucleoside triphosphate hydrolase protein [Chlamydoabsidia padenii]|nr:P-loop containing nucleoside triphosphate hydrolase protein [Chlamydoabsidia padenii]
MATYGTNCLFIIIDRLTEMKNTSHIRLDSLKRYQNDTYKAYMWYRENKTLFRGKVYGPVQLCLNLKDKRYAEQVETALGGKDSSHLRTFVFEYADDYKKFMAELVDKQKLRLTAGWPGDIDVSAVTRTPCTEENLKERFGLEHFVINLLDGPALVLAYLCQQVYINTYPVSLAKVNIEKIVDESNFQRFVVANNSYRVKKYAYGRGGSQTTVRTVPKAMILNDTMDKVLFEQKMNELKDLELTMAAIDSEIKILHDKKTEYNQKLSELKHKRDDKKALRQDVKDKRHKWEGQVRRLKRFKEELATKTTEPAEMEKEIESLKEQILQEAKHRGKLVLKYKKVVESYVKLIMRRNRASLKSLSSHGRYEAMVNFTKSQRLMVSEATNKHLQVNQRCVSLKANTRRHYELANQAGENLPDHLKEEFKMICQDWNVNGFDQTYIQIEDAIHGLRAKADALKMVNPLAINTYEKLVAEMKKLEEKIASNTQDLATLDNEIKQLHRNWQPRLENLVSRISDKFAEALQRIGCAGEVGIGRDEDYSKWGIEIRVKFRDHEKLQLLTGQRQSGGERAVSTILYLMSLQSLARAPFRVVDEINQGMDPRNERMIHEQIVKSASMAGTSQYFLITPKLLPDLYYNEHMRVLCIYNGEWQPETLKTAEHYLQQAKAALTAA